MTPKKLKYELDQAIVQTLLKIIDRTQIVGLQNASNLLEIVRILQNPLNAEEIEKESLEELKAKYEPKKEEKAK